MPAKFQLFAHGHFLPDFPTLSAPITSTFASAFRAAGPGTSSRAGWSGVKLALLRSRSPMPSVAVPCQQSQQRVRGGRQIPRHPGDPRGPPRSRQPPGSCGRGCSRRDSKLCNPSIGSSRHTSAPGWPRHPAAWRAARSSAAARGPAACPRLPAGHPSVPQHLPADSMGLVGSSGAARDRSITTGGGAWG